ncbi:MAG TPA: DUF362 domain-containing protein [Candidatus Brocadiia bacterium]|nr:DUF362 domain-containing protein [Candidatus Brocadiia bacterium]
MSFSADGRCSRRQLIKSAAAAGAGSLLSGPAAVMSALRIPLYAQAADAAPTAKSLVVEVVNPKWQTEKKKPDPAVMREMIARALCLFTGKTSVSDALRCYVSPEDKIGLKFNSLSFDFMRTNAPIAAIMMEFLQDIGAQRGNIASVEGRDVDVKGCMAPDLTFGPEIEVHDKKTRLTNFITKQTDCIINLPDLKDHGGAGVTCALKNLSHSMSVVAQPSNMHDNNCNPYIPVVNSMEPVKTKRRISICTAFKGVFEGGPMPSKPQNQWLRNSVIVATDPVAMDRVALELVQAARKERNKTDLFMTGRKPLYIAKAAEMGLGTNDMEKIDWRIVEM